MSFLVLAQGDDGSGGAIIGAIVSLVVALLCGVLVIAGTWKTYAKAGKPGWASIVPIYNMIVALEIAGKPAWWIILFCIPLVNLIMAIVVFIEFAKAFGKGTGFGLGLVFLFPLFILILGFGDARYVGNRSNS